jgi:hypothetical protein
MPTATPTSTERSLSDDAPRASAPGGDDARLPKPAKRVPETVDADYDPYDNVACTD